MGIDIKKRIKGLEKLPTISSMQPKLFEVIQKNNSTVQDVVNVIKHDQVMATRIIEMANAPAFGQNGKIRDIDQAVFVLGFDSVKNIALGVSLFVMFPLSKVALKILWAHACATAVLADKIAQKEGSNDRGTCFLAGLVHDIGRLVLINLETELYFREILDNKSFRAADLIATEKKLFGCDHQQAGAWFLEAFSMPDDIIKVVASHHNAQAARGKGRAASAVCLAEAISSLCDNNDYGDGVWTKEHDLMAATFNFSKDDRESFIAFLNAERKRLRTFFGY